MPFLQYRGSRARLFSDLSAGESRPPRLSGSRWRAGLPSPHSPPSADLRFPPLINSEKTAPSHQALQKRHRHPQMIRCTSIYDALYSYTPRRGPYKKLLTNDYRNSNSDHQAFVTFKIPSSSIFSIGVPGKNVLIPIAPSFSASCTGMTPPTMRGMSTLFSSIN